jgi:uncharacterized protein with FMN-binding domain
MKRALLIAGGTVGGLGAVLAITPPQLSSSSSINIAGGAGVGSTSTTASASSSTSPQATTTATKSSKPVATKKATATATATASASATATATTTASPTASATPTATAAATHTAAPAAPATKSVSGTFTGPAIFVNYGTVQVKITVANGHITDAVAVQAPSGRNDRYTQMAVPILKQQTLAAQSANIKGASGASYTSYGWFKSLQGALADAGL